MNNDEHRQKGNNRDEESSVSKEKHTKKAKPKAYEEEQPSKPFIKWPSQVTINTISTVVIAFFTVVLWFTSCNQLDSMREQTKAMQAQLAEMKSGSEDTKTIAEAARHQAETAKILADSSSASTAAWIVTDTWDYKIEKDRIVFEMGYKNVGKTAAIDTKFGMEFTLIEGPNLGKIPLYAPFQCPPMNASPGILPPNERVINKITNKPYSVDQLRLIADGKGKIFIHGCIIYRDVISDRERITEIGVTYVSKDRPNSPFIIYAPYNRMK